MIPFFGNVEINFQNNWKRYVNSHKSLRVWIYPWLFAINVRSLIGETKVEIIVQKYFVVKDFCFNADYSSIFFFFLCFLLVIPSFVALQVFPVFNSFLFLLLVLLQMSGKASNFCNLSFLGNYLFNVLYVLCSKIKIYILAWLWSDKVIKDLGLSFSLFWICNRDLIVCAICIDFRLQVFPYVLLLGLLWHPLFSGKNPSLFGDIKI